MLELELMQYYAIVVEQNSLNRASKVLNISQPALSRKISKLEELLGVQLFERKGKRLKLTEAGNLTYDFALQLAQLERKFQKDLLRFKSLEAISELHIGASLTTLQSTLPDIIRLFTEKGMKYDIKATTGKTHEVVEMVKDHRVEFGIVASSIQHSELHSLPLFEDHLALVVPKQHPLSSEQQVGIEQLNKLSMILFSKGTWYRVLMDELFLQHHVHPDIKMEIDSFEAIIRLISLSDYATLLPLSYIRPSILEYNQLSRIEVKELQETTRTTSLIYRKDSVFHPDVEERIQACISFFRKTREGD